MKKLLFGLLIAIMITGTAFAANAGVNVITVDGLYSGELVTVTVNYPEDYSSRGTVYIVPESGLSAAAAGDISSAIFAGESESVTKSPVYKFELPDGMANGVYVIVTDGGEVGDERCSRYFVYNGDEDAVDAKLDALDSASDITAAIESGIGSVWYVDTDNAAWKNSASRVAELAESLADGSFDSAKEVEDTVDAAMDIINASEAEILADLTHLNDILGCNTSDGQFTNKRDEVVTRFAGYLRSEKPKTKAEVQALFMEACAITCINNSSAEQIIYDLRAYNNVFGLDFSGDYRLVDTYSLAKKLAGTKYTSAQQLKKKFDDEVKALKPPETPSGGTTGGGGGLGFGGGGGGGGGGGMAASGSVSGENIIDEIAQANRIFPDVADDHWAKLYIDYVYNSHIMSGDTDGNFRPDDAITREEWTKVVLNTFAIEVGDAVCEFEDVSVDDWFYPYVAKAFELRVINGISDNLFGAGQSVTRQDAVVILERAMKLTRTLTSTQEEEAVVFTDNDDIAEYAADAIKTFSSLKVINGYEDGSFAPRGNITRAEGAKIIKALLDAIE